MTRVIIQPASNKDSRKHFVDTVENPVDLSLHQPSAGSDFDKLMQLSENGKVAMWGVTPGKNGANLSKFKKIEVGDFVLIKDISVDLDKWLICSIHRVNRCPSFVLAKVQSLDLIKFDSWVLDRQYLRV